MLQPTPEKREPTLQQQEVLNEGGNCVVLAGPGSGKTFVLTEKVRNLIAAVDSPRGIACITYSVACADELRSRLGSTVPAHSRRLSVGTVHSFCLHHILRPFARLAGIPLPASWQVIDWQKGKRLLSDHLVKENLGHIRPWDVSLSRRKRIGRFGESRSSDDLDSALARHEEALVERGLVDFDLIVSISVYLVESFPWVRASLGARYPYLVVDEYQDLSPAVHRIVESLCLQANYCTLLAVGDPDQSVYGFMGANPEVLNALSADARVRAIRLSRNFRSGHRIVSSSEFVLQEERGFTSAVQAPGEIIVAAVGDVSTQLRFVVDELVPEAVASGTMPGEIAVLGLKNDVLETLRSELNTAGIRVSGGLKKTAFSPTPFTNWVLDCARYGLAAKKEPLDVAELLRYWRSYRRDETSIRNLNTCANLMQFLWLPQNGETLAVDWLRDFARCVLKNSLKNTRRAADRSTLAGLFTAINSGGSFEGLRLDELALMRRSNDAVNLLTLHSSKGLEFELVVIVGMSDESMPGWCRTDNDLREKRRLFYVGLTRAKSTVVVCCPAEDDIESRSQFVRDLEESLALGTVDLPPN